MAKGRITRPIPKLTQEQVLEFWSKVGKKSRGCWLWQGYTRRDGYGYRRVGKYQFLAHRVAYFLQKQKQPGHKLVCHTCDNRLCCNPRHLFLGTYKDNNADRAKKGRNGTRVNTKLTPTQVRAIRKSNLSTYKLAAKYNVSPTTIWFARVGVTHKQVK